MPSDVGSSDVGQRAARRTGKPPGEQVCKGRSAWKNILKTYPKQKVGGWGGVEGAPAGPPEMGASTTSRPSGDDAISSPTPCTSPSELTRKSAYSFEEEGRQAHVIVGGSLSALPSQGGASLRAPATMLITAETSDVLLAAK
jgi:hypothetical protein